MKRNIIVGIALALVGMAAALGSPSASAADKVFGVRGGYASHNQSAVAGIFFSYGFSDHLRLQPAVDYVFRRDNIDALQINLDCQVPFAVGAKTEVYPFGGVDVSSWNFHNAAATDDATTRITRFGLNLGAGAAIHLTPTLQLSAEAKYVLIRHFDGAQITVSIGYTF